MLKPNTLLKTKIFGLVGAALFSLAALADELALQPNHPDTYTVVKGDTLWDISGKFLQKPWLWPQIWHNNPNIANPDLIYPGDVLNLTYVDGKPQINVRRGERGNTVKLSPSDGKLSPTIRSEPLDNPIPTIPLDVINPFLVGSRIVNNGELKTAPYALAGTQSHLTAGSGDLFYARGNFDKSAQIYGIFRRGKTYTDPKSGEVLGVQAIDIGSAKIKSIENDVAQFTITRSTQEVLPNDRLLPNQERKVEAIFHPSAPETQVSGHIIDVEGGVSQIGPMSVVVLDRGERDGLKVGNVLAIYQKGERVKDPVTGEWVHVMDERAGLAMTFNVFPKASYALVLMADRPLHLGEIVRNP